MTIRLDTNNPFANFTQEGGQAITPSATAVNFNDSSEVDKVLLFGSDPGAAKGKEIDLLGSFKVGAFIQDGADTGVRFVINNGEDQSAICACTIDTAGQTVVPESAIAGALRFTRFRLFDAESADQLAFRGDFTLGAGTNGIEPTTEPARILATPATGD